MQRRAATAMGTRSVPLVPAAACSATSGPEWAQAELSSYFKSHPDKLTLLLDRICVLLRKCSNGDMAPFIAEMDTMIETLNEDIDEERRDVAGRTARMTDYSDVTNDFLHFFLDGVMDEMEKEQSSPAAGAGAGRSALQPSRRASAPMGAGGSSLRASSAAPASAGGGSGRFATGSAVRRSQQ